MHNVLVVYKQLSMRFDENGTLSLLAGIDLLTGEVFPLVSETHKSSDRSSYIKNVLLGNP